MEQDHQPQHFYQKFPTWIALSFLTGATVMVGAVILLNTDTSTPGSLALTPPTSSPAAADVQIAQIAGDVISVNISQPAEGEVVSLQGFVSIRASASAVNTVKNMVILIDGQLVKTCTEPSCSVIVTASGLPNSYLHTVQVIAMSLDGNTNSAIRHFSVLSQ